MMTTFATRVKAGRKGEGSTTLVKKLSSMCYPANLAEILTIFFAPLIGLPFPVPITSLDKPGNRWLPGLALVTEPAENIS